MRRHQILGAPGAEVAQRLGEPERGERVATAPEVRGRMTVPVEAVRLTGVDRAQDLKQPVPVGRLSGDAVGTPEQGPGEEEVLHANVRVRNEAVRLVDKEVSVAVVAGGRQQFVGETRRGEIVCCFGYRVRRHDQGFGETRNVSHHTSICARDPQPTQKRDSGGIHGRRLDGMTIDACKAFSDRARIGVQARSSLGVGHAGPSVRRLVIRT